MREDDFMRDEYDFSNGVVKNYSDQFSNEEKLKMILEAFMENAKITKDELKREVDLVLS